MPINPLAKSKNIALWTCPRSRSTLVTRAFEQLDEGIIFDEPFCAPYILHHGFNQPHRQELLAFYKNDHDYIKVIEKITGDLPPGASFSFQKHMSKHVLPDFGKEWMQDLHHVFLIRDPKEIVLSWHKVCGDVTAHDIGMEVHYQIFKYVQSFSQHTPLVLDSIDLVRNPEAFLRLICSHFNLNFSSRMLTWKAGLKDSNLLFSGALSSLASTWYEDVANSTGFLPYQEKEISLTDNLKRLAEDCFPFY
ncbi:MAG: hypothetical protein AAGD25_05075 [Cyanobacteria bacterium P01_F01_bin.150]